MKKFFKINVLLLWIFITYVVTLPISIPVTNDIIAANVERKLKKTDLPPNTKLCDSTSIAGRFTGNGNGMEFFGAIYVVYSQGSSKYPLSDLDIRGH